MGQEGNYPLLIYGFNGFSIISTNLENRVQRMFRVNMRYSFINNKYGIKRNIRNQIYTAKNTPILAESHTAYIYLIGLIKLFLAATSTFL